MLAVFILLQIADAYTTHRVLAQGGYERNRLLAVLFERFGHIPVLAVFKGIVIVLFLTAPLPDWMLFCFCVLYALIVFQNARLIK